MASTPLQSGSRKRMLTLLGALTALAVTYLCLPRSWFEIPDENAPAAQASAPSASHPSLQPKEARTTDTAALRSAAEQSPLDFTARSRYGMALAAAGNSADAEKEFIAARRLAPESPVVYHNLGIFYHNQRQPVRADAAFRRELELAPGNARAHHYRGLALQEQRQFKAAIRQFRLALALEPDFADAYLSLAILLSRDEPEQEVRRLVEEYIRLTGNKGLAYYVLSGAYRSRRDYVSAARYGELAVEAEPEKYSYLHNLGQIYSYAKEHAKADKTLRRTLDFAKDPSAILIELGMNAQSAGAFSDAINFFQQALKASPHTGNIHLYMARAYQRMGDKAAARREEQAFRTWQREALAADARAKQQQAERQSHHASQKP